MVKAAHAMTSRRPSPLVGADVGANTGHQSRTHACGHSRSASTRPALGQHRRNRQCQPTLAPAKAVNAGSDLAIDAAQPTAGTKGSEITTPRRPAGHKSVARSRT